MILLPAVTLTGPVMLPAQGGTVTVIECVSVAVPPLVHVTVTDTERLPAVTPVTAMLDDELLPLNPVPTVQA